MGLTVLIIIIIAVVSIVRKATSGSTGTQAQVLTPEMFSANSKGTWNDIVKTVEGAQKIKEQGNGAVMPVRISFSVESTGWGRVYIMFTLPLMDLRPFHDMESYYYLLTGQKSPEFLKGDYCIETDKSKEFDKEDFDRQWKEKSTAIRTGCLTAIYMELFGTEQGGFPQDLDSYELTVPNRAAGTVDVVCDWLSLEPPSIEQQFLAIGQGLRAKFPSASVNIRSTEITVSF